MTLNQSSSYSLVDTGLGSPHSCDLRLRRVCVQPWLISLLAITVSAQILPSTSATDDALQCDQNPVQEKIQELTISYQLQEELALELEGFEELKKEELETKLIMDGLKNGFKRKGLSKAGKLDLEKQYDAAVEDWKQAESAVMDRKT
ncbi:hypothetical protein BASA50_007663 [Batrachochytrium salamandrivorans]|uniref:Uncharacterized protein n=1 Tax=Batrachochytrium salamandrivorans TaxID=1357716 RepID=A0ABQ8F6D8_9FUNG|nr:hypothetical protein BASA50_007663 [Batrachochytrium salamandrivorans]